MLKPSELRGLSIEELEEKVTHLKRDLMQFRFQVKTGKLERQSTVGDTRRDIARLLTVLSEKKREGKS